MLLRPFNFSSSLGPIPSTSFASHSRYFISCVAPRSREIHYLLFSLAVDSGRAPRSPLTPSFFLVPFAAQMQFFPRPLAAASSIEEDRAEKREGGRGRDMTLTVISDKFGERPNSSPLSGKTACMGGLSSDFPLILCRSLIVVDSFGRVEGGRQKMPAS
jgi:hypothetical protein